MSKVHAKRLKTMCSMSYVEFAYLRIRHVNHKGRIAYCNWGFAEAAGTRITYRAARRVWDGSAWQHRLKVFVFEPVSHQSKISYSVIVFVRVIVWPIIVCGTRRGSGYLLSLEQSNRHARTGDWADRECINLNSDIVPLAEWVWIWCQALSCNVSKCPKCDDAR